MYECLLVGLSVYHVCALNREEESVGDPLKLELYPVVSCHAGAGN